MDLPVLRDYKYSVPGKGRITYFEDLNNARYRILEDLKLPPAGKFLDVGTGDGWFSLDAQTFLSDGLVFSIELGWNDVEELIAKSKDLGGNPLCYVQMDAYHQAFANQTFDFAGTFLALQDICFSAEALDQLFHEVARVLKPGGRFVIATITPEDAETDSQRLGIELYQSIRAGYFSKADLKNALESAGFEVEPSRFYYTGVNLTPKAALSFVKFQTGFWVEYYQMETVDWESAWAKYGPRIEQLGGLEVEAKITVVTGTKH